MDEPLIYLNHAGTSWPKPAEVVDATQDAWDSDPSAWPERFKAAHQDIMEFFDVPSPSQLLLAPACTSALSVAVFDHFWNAGDRVLTSGWEHHAMHRPLVKLVDQGVELEIIPHLPHEPLLLEPFEAMLRDGGVKLVAISMASNVTGDLLPYEEVIQLAHQFGALVLLDAAQVAGWWEMSLPQLGADIVAFAGHKALHGPWGIGGLYISPNLEMNSPAAVCEITYDAETGKTKPTPAGPGWCDLGSVDRAALEGLSAATRWLKKPEQVDRLSRARGFAQRIHDTLRESSRVSLYGSDAPKGRLPTVAFNMNQQPSSQVASALRALGLHVASGMQCAPLAHKSLETAPEGVVRISVGAQTTEDEIERAVRILREFVR